MCDRGLQSAVGGEPGDDLPAGVASASGERGRALTESRLQTRRIAFGTAARLAGRTLGAVISLIALRQATRYFGPVDWGPITAALAWFAMFSYLGSPGVATLTMREIARPGTDARSVFGQALGATFVVSLAATIVAIAIGVPVYWGRGTTLEMVLILMPGIPMTALFLTSGAVLVGRGRNGGRSLLDLESSVFLLAATLLVVGGHFHQRGYAIAYLAALAANSATALALALHCLRPKLRGAGKGISRMLRRSLPLGQFDFFAVIYARADSIMLFFIAGNRAVAYYGVAFQIAVFIFALPALFANVLLPDFMSADAARKQFLARRALDVILTVALPLPIFGIVFARPFVVWLAGSAFAPAGTLLAILTAAAGISLVNGYLFQMAVFAGAERGLWRAAGVATVSNLAANALAVSLWGAIGAAVVMIFSECVGLVLYFRLYRSTMPSPLGRRYPLSTLIAAVGLAVLCWVLHADFGVDAGTHAGIVPRAVALFVVYLGLVWILTAGGRRLAASRRLPQPPAAGFPEG